MDDAFDPDAPAPKSDEVDLEPMDYRLPTQATPAATRYLLKNYKALTKMDTRREGFEVSLVENNLYKWRARLFDYDAKEPLAQDLKRTPHGDIIVEIVFSPDTPFSPPFCRVVRPQFMFRTGHVTLGGAICTELLTKAGWSPANTGDFLIIQLRAIFITGGGRLDLSKSGEYSEREAREAFERLKATHGWTE
eukprot:GAFH01002321.1.p3 GENE.GAFH01002321.1~~GAFH01002321.1.p3  ORF type:complete len:192 (-),score=94.87 GAFH01002321.1:158-733(-)